MEEKQEEKQEDIVLEVQDVCINALTLLKILEVNTGGNNGKDNK